MTSQESRLNDLYDRQTRTYGVEAINYLKNGKVFKSLEQLKTTP